MDCPILCGGGGEPVLCPDKRCPLYEAGKASCQLLSATTQGKSSPEAEEAVSGRSRGKARTKRAAAEAEGREVTPAANDLFGRVEGIESRLSLLAARMGEAAAASREAQEHGESELHATLESIATKVRALEGKVGDLPERLTQLASKIVGLADMLDRKDGASTLEKLEATVDERLAALDRRLDEEAKRADLREGQQEGDRQRHIERISARMQEVEKSVAASVSEVQQSIGRIADGLGELPDRLGGREGEADEARALLDAAFGRMDARFEELGRTLQEQAERSELRRMERQEDESGERQELVAGISSVTTKIEEVAGQVRSLADRLEALSVESRREPESAIETHRLLERVSEQVGRVASSVEWLDAVRDEVGAARAESREGREALGSRLAEIAGKLEGLHELDELRRGLITLRDDLGLARDSDAEDRRSLQAGLEQISGRLHSVEGLPEAVGAVRSEVTGAAESLRRELQTTRDELGSVRSEVTGASESLRRELEVTREETHEAAASVRDDLAVVQRQVERIDGITGALEASRRDAAEVLEALQRRRRLDDELARRSRAAEATEQNSRGVLLFHEGAIEGAVESFRRAVEQRSDYAEAHNNLGLALTRLGRHDDAVAAFRQALECDPELPAALNNLGFLYQSQQRHAEAVEMFHKALEVDPHMAAAYVNLGNAYYGLERNAQAVEAWRKALEIDPVNDDAARALRSFDQEIPGGMS